MTHFLLHLNRWPTSIQLLASIPSVSYSPIVHSNLFFPSIPHMRLGSLSNSIMVDVMATEEMEDADNTAMDDISCSCVSYTDTFKLEPHQGNVSLFSEQ